MAQFRSSADILDLALTNAGEVTSGRSQYETQALDFLNKVNFVLLAGGTIPLGKDTTVEIDEVWPWARSFRPFVIELQPKYDSGTVAFTQGSEAGTFSSAPSYSVAGWHIRVEGTDEVYRIASHTAASTAFEIDGYYADTSVTAGNFQVMKIDYDLVPDLITVDQTNLYIQFQKAAGVTLTGTLTAGAYTPAQLATHVAAVITVAAGGPTVTGAYSAVTRKFTLTSDLAGATSFSIVGNGTQAPLSVHKDLGFDDITTTSAAAQTSVYVLGGIARLIEPLKVHRGSGDGLVSSLDAEAFARDYPLKDICEGVPDRFVVISERSDGVLTVRLNKFVQEKTRLEADHIKVPRDLKDDATSLPLIPRKHVDVLEYATSFFLCFLKSDDRMNVYAELTKGKLMAMKAQHRGTLLRAGENFGQIIPRRDLSSKRRIIFSDPY